MDTPPDSKRPTLTDRALAERQTRALREAAALRANLHKRKAQARSRADDAVPVDKPD